MSYLNYIIENEEVANLTDTHQASIESIIHEATQNFILTNFEYVVENIESFLQDVQGDIFAFYESVKQFAMADYMHMIDAINEVAALDESFDHVQSVISEDASDVFTGLGYGAQKAHLLLTTTYESSEEDDIENTETEDA